METIYLPFNSSILEQNRYAKWVKLSYKAIFREEYIEEEQNSISIFKEPDYSIFDASQFQMITIQGLGRLDSQLIENEKLYINLVREDKPVIALDIFLLSYLWVLGAYEVVRNMDKWLRKIDDQNHIIEHLRETKNYFSKLRIPLAKYEKQSKPKIIKIAYTCLTQNGIGWIISENEIITRLELSNKLFDLLNKIG